MATRSSILQQQQQQQQNQAWAGWGQGRQRQATTVFDLIRLPASGGTGAGIVQSMPPRTYDLHIDGFPYSVIALEGLGESDYLRALIDQRAALAANAPNLSQPWQTQQRQTTPPVSIDLSCGITGGRPTQRVRDSAFLLLAYGITSTSDLDAAEQLCLLDIALALGLPLAFGDWLAVLTAPSAIDGLPSKVRDVATLCRVIDAVGAALPAATALAPGLTPQATARALARCALGALLRSSPGGGGDAPEPMTAVLLALASARGPAGFAPESARAWNRALVDAFGEAYAADRTATNPLGALPVALTGSHFVMMAEPAIGGRSDLFGDQDGDEEAVPGGGGCGASVPPSEAAVVEERVRRFYADKTSAVAERVREALGALIGRWLASPSGAGADIVVTYAMDPADAAFDTTSPGASGLLPNRQIIYYNVRYDPAATAAKAATGAGEGDAYYSYSVVPAGSTGEQRFEAPLRGILGGPWVRLDVRIGLSHLATAGLGVGDCARPDVLLPAIGWPLPFSVSPYDASTCTVSADVGTIVAALPADPVLRASLASAASP